MSPECVKCTNQCNNLAEYEDIKFDIVSTTNEIIRTYSIGLWMFVEEIDKLSGPDKLILTNDAYGCFSVGENVVEKIGLFDEYYYPIYFEDNDFHERVARFCPENTIVSTAINTAPEVGSQTINSDDKLKNINHQTFVKNEEYYKYKQTNNFQISKPWSLSRRRDHEWLR